MKRKISDAVVRRLPIYLRYLEELLHEGVEHISSNELSGRIGFTASQIRQDLNNFGGFGQQGYGYNVKDLHDEISAILGLDQVYHMVIVGGGNLGHAIAGYTNSYKQGFQVEAIFEVDSDAIGTEIGGVPVLSSDNLVEYVEEHKIDIGVICTPKDVAQDIADRLCFAGVRGIWNFAQTDLEVPSHVAMENVHLSDNLYALTFHMNRK